MISKVHKYLFGLKQILYKVFVVNKKTTSIGIHTYGTPKVYSYDDGTKLSIGKYCSISSRVTIFLGGEHRYDWISTFPFNVRWGGFPEIKGTPRSKGDVIIGNDVWIGYGATIFSGVKIGDGAVIGAHAVVRKDVPPYAIFYGNPASLHFYRFETEQIKKLLEIKWWDWDVKKIRKHVPVLQSNQLDEFFKIASSDSNKS